MGSGRIGEPADLRKQRCSLDPVLRANLRVAMERALESERGAADARTLLAVLGIALMAVGGALLRRPKALPFQ